VEGVLGHAKTYKVAVLEVSQFDLG
jgi:hypothetical protein